MTIHADWQRLLAPYLNAATLTWQELCVWVQQALQQHLIHTKVQGAWLVPAIASYLRQTCWLYVEQQGQLKLQYLPGLVPKRAEVQLADPVYLKKSCSTALTWPHKPPSRRQLHEVCYDLANSTSMSKIYFYLPKQYFAKWQLTRVVVSPEKLTPQYITPGSALSLTPLVPKRYWTIYFDAPHQTHIRYKVKIFRCHASPVQSRQYLLKTFSLPQHH